MKVDRSWPNEPFSNIDILELFKIANCSAYVQISKIFSVILLLFSYHSLKTYVLVAQKNRLIETVLLSTHNICFG